MNGSHLLINAKRKIFVDDGEDVPTLGDVYLGLLLANSSDDLMVPAIIVTSDISPERQFG